jgi:hypothetical protein
MVATTVSCPKLSAVDEENYVPGDTVRHVRFIPFRFVPITYITSATGWFERKEIANRGGPAEYELIGAPPASPPMFGSS